jgi:hypothetical protein
LSILKTLSSGNPLLADKKFSKGVAFSPFSKLIFTTNNLPRIDIDDYGFYRRIILINFPYNVDSMPKQSRQTFRLLKDKTTKDYWLDCLFTYLLKHLNKMLEELKATESIHFDYCYEVEDNEKKYKELSIPALIYLKSSNSKLEITGNPNDVLTTREVRDIIVTGLNEMKINHHYDTFNDGGLLTKDLQKCGDVHSSRKTMGGEVKTVYTGIRIKNDDGPKGKEKIEKENKDVKIIDVLNDNNSCDFIKNEIVNEKTSDNQINNEIKCIEPVKRTSDGGYVINGYILYEKDIREYNVVFIEAGCRDFVQPNYTYVIEFINPLTNQKDYTVLPTEKFLLACLNNVFKHIDNLK